MLWSISLYAYHYCLVLVGRSMKKFPPSIANLLVIWCTFTKSRYVVQDWQDAVVRVRGIAAYRLFFGIGLSHTWWLSSSSPSNPRGFSPIWALPLWEVMTKHTPWYFIDSVIWQLDLSCFLSHVYIISTKTCMRSSVAFLGSSIE